MSIAQPLLSVGRTNQPFMSLSPEIPAFLLLHLRSIDDDASAILSWRGAIGGQQPLAAQLTLAYTDHLAKLPKLSPIELQLGVGYSRLFALVSVEPAPEARKIDLALFDLAPEPEPAKAEPSLFSHTIEFEASPKLAADLQKFVEFISLRGNTSQVALRSGERLWSN
jgi:hypothetical protein